MNIVIIEDEAPAFRRLEKILLEIDPNINILEVLDSVESATNWLAAWKNVIEDDYAMATVACNVLTSTSLNVPKLVS